MQEQYSPESVSQKSSTGQHWTLSKVYIFPIPITTTPRSTAGKEDYWTLRYNGGTTVP